MELDDVKIELDWLAESLRREDYFSNPNVKPHVLMEFAIVQKIGQLMKDDYWYYNNLNKVARKYGLPEYFNPFGKIEDVWDEFGIETSIEGFLKKLCKLGVLKKVEKPLKDGLEYKYLFRRKNSAYGHNVVVFDEELSMHVKFSVFNMKYIWQAYENFGSKK